MPRETIVWRKQLDGTMRLVTKGGPEDTGHPFHASRANRSALACPMIISDHLDDLIGQHDGKAYSSKRALRNSYRAQGLEEIGDEKQQIFDADDRYRGPTNDEIEQAIEKVAQGYKPDLPIEPEEI